jgi:hypothetical protein
MCSRCVFYNRARSATRCRSCEEIVTIAAGAAHGDEEAARLDGPAVVRYTGRFRREDSPHLRDEAASRQCVTYPLQIDSHRRGWPSCTSDPAAATLPAAGHVLIDGAVTRRTLKPAR